MRRNRRCGAALILAAGLLALAVAGGFLVACVVLGVVGLAQLVGVALGDRPWAGNLITGFGLLTICTVATAIGMVLVNRRFRERTEAPLCPTTRTAKTAIRPRRPATGRTWLIRRPRAAIAPSRHRCATKPPPRATPSRRRLPRCARTVSDAGDVRAWTREYPWASVGAAATIGFLAAAALTARPSRRSSGDLLQKILADEQIAARIRELSESDAAPGPTLLSSLGSVLMPKLANVLEAAVIAALTLRGDAAESTANGSPDDGGSADSGARELWTRRRRPRVIHPPPMAGRKWISLSTPTGANKPREVIAPSIETASPPAIAGPSHMRPAMPGKRCSRAVIT